MGNNALGLTNMQLVWLVVAFDVLYWLPTLVALARRSSMARVLAINVLTGWTVIGWLAALRMARSDYRRHVPSRLEIAPVHLPPAPMPTWPER